MAEKQRAKYNVTFRIGELARDVGINPKTIRYYEEIGLMPRPVRSAAGYRLYSTADRERLRFIRKAKAVGLTLNEISEVVDLRGDGSQPCQHVLALIDQKLKTIDDQIRALEEFRDELNALREIDIELSRTDACYCWIIEQHADDREAASARDMAG